MVSETVAFFGRVDYAINCAGIAYKSNIADLGLNDFSRVVDLNLRAVYLCMREEICQMTKQTPLKLKKSYGQVRGSIVNIASIAGVVAIKSSSAYTASKHGVVGVTKTAALENPEIRINAIAPGYIATPLILSGTPELLAAGKEKTELFTPMKRYGEPDEIGNVCSFLLGGRSSYITGAIFRVDGGLTAH
ncbi:hypothetical protein V1511DRAFT_200691 [Dipodascopsis uninucleata]